MRPRGLIGARDVSVVSSAGEDRWLAPWKSASRFGTSKLMSAAVWPATPDTGLDDFRMRLRQLRLRDDIVLAVIHHECIVPEMAMGADLEAHLT